MLVLVSHWPSEAVNVELRGQLQLFGADPRREVRTLANQVIRALAKRSQLIDQEIDFKHDAASILLFNLELGNFGASL